VLDAALALLVGCQPGCVVGSAEDLIAAIRDQAQVHRHTVMMADRTAFMLNRSRLVSSYGGLAEVLRHQDRLTRLRQEIAVGKISGAVELMPILSRR